MIIKGGNKTLTGPTAISNFLTETGKTYDDLKTLDNIEELRLRFIYWFFVQKFLEITLVFCITFLGFQWRLVYDVIDEKIWHFSISILLEAIILHGVRLQRDSWLNHYPGIYLVQIINILFMTSVILFFGVHGSKIYPNLCPFFATLAAATASLTYAFYATLAFMKQIHYSGPSYWLAGLVMPLVVIIFVQPLYFYNTMDETFDKTMYIDYNINIIYGMIITLLVSYENIYSCKQFVNSEDTGELLRMADLLNGPGVNEADVKKSGKGYRITWFRCVVDGRQKEVSESEKK